MSKEKNLVMAFQFNATSSKVRSLLINSEPFFVAKDVCNILEIASTEAALRKLDSDEKLMRKLYASGQNRKMSMVSESGLYALIMRSNKPEAKTFRKWVTSEVLPAIRKKGYYGMRQVPSNFIDARDLPYVKKEYNGVGIRCIVINNKELFSVNDVHKAIHSTTSSHYAVKKLNVKQTLAQKVWLFGNTHPAWFTNLLGVKLIISGSRTFKKSNQILLKL